MSSTGHAGFILESSDVHPFLDAAPQTPRETGCASDSTNRAAILTFSSHETLRWISSEESIALSGMDGDDS